MGMLHLDGVLFPGVTFILRFCVMADTTASLFADLEQQNLDQSQPLAARMRPKHLSEFTGQRHLLDEENCFGA